MSGLTIPINGSGSPAPVTSFFGYVPDKYTVLAAAHSTAAASLGQPIPGGTPTIDNPNPAFLINSWTIFNPLFQGGANHPTLTLGATTTAPDGSTNAQKIVESSDAGSTSHFLAALAPYYFGLGPGPVSVPIPFRVGVFAKAAERTRIAVYIADVSGNTGFKTVFDLANAKIGVANTKFGSTGGFVEWTAGPTSIIRFSNNWCLCYMDVNLGTSNDHIQVAVALDSGSGTAAESTGYTGNGSSGAFVWKATALPPGCWQINSLVNNFDFNNTNDIDLNNTKVPGFNWYVDMSTWPHTGFAGVWKPVAAGNISVSSSILTINAYGGVSPITEAWAMTSANWVGPGTNDVIGNLFQPPWLIEYKGLLQQPNSQTIPQAIGELAFMWSGTTEWAGNVANAGPKMYEVDAIDLGVNRHIAGSNFLRDTLPIGQTIFQEVQAPPGTYPYWQSHRQYSGGGVNRVFYTVDGNAYLASGGGQSTVGTPPPSQPAFWTQITQPSGILNFAPVGFDAGVTSATMSFIWAPALSSYQNGNELYGHYLIFMNGIFLLYFFSTPGDIRDAEGGHYTLFLESAQDTPSMIDYIKVSH